MRYLLYLAVFLVAGCTDRELAGDSARLTPEQIVWLEKRVEADFAGFPITAADKVAMGIIVVRADGEVISTRPIIQAAMRGLVKAGAVETEGGEATLLIKGEINVNSFQEDLRTVTRYVCAMKLAEVKSRSVVLSQTYTITNRHEQAKWK